MSLNYSNRMNNIKASEIRELLKLTQQPQIISFAGGMPAKESFPIEEFSLIGKEVMDTSGAQALQYGPTEGIEGLRVAIAERMTKVGVEGKTENILVTSGSQQGLDFSAKVFINPGDVIVCESPTYLGAINAFRAYEPEFVEVETDKDGMLMDQLEKVLKEKDNVRFIYVIPDFQNPSGKTWSIERRKKLVELANEYNVAIVEDNPYGELRFEGEKLPAVKHYDTEGRVIFLGTFSKILAPGFRLGWVYAEPEVLNKYILVKQGADLQSSTISQMEAAKFFEQYSIDDHIAKIIELYRVRRDAMINTMEAEFPEGVEFTRPEGGLFTWVVLPEHMNARELAVKALDKNVAYVPGGSFYPNGGNENTMRLNYSAMEEEKIVEGIKRLAEVIKSEM